MPRIEYLQRIVLGDSGQVAVIMQQLNVVHQSGSGNHAIHRFANGDSLGAQRAVNLGRFDKDILGHRQKLQKTQIGPGAMKNGIVANTLQDLGQDDSAKCDVFPLLDQKFQSPYMRQIVIPEKINLYAGVNKDHR